MDGDLDEPYMHWLYSQVASLRVKTLSRTYWNLLAILHHKEFIWLVPNDDNRVEDGRDLRYEFLDCEGIDVRDVDRDWLLLGCSVLEMMIALSRHLSFEAEGEPAFWFWILIKNLDLIGYTDNKEIPKDEVDHILDQLIWRTYDRDGSGGLFPLKRPTRDQRNVEIWYQMSAYILELDD